MTPLWQILVPTLACATRRMFLARLQDRLRPQLTADVELVTLEDNGELTIGEKRQAMLTAATSLWVCFFDDDDVPCEDYVSSILEVLNADACDVVGFKQMYLHDGIYRAVAVHSYNANDIPVGPLPRRVSRMNRLPNHLNPVRRELALRVGYLPRNTGEDSEYARRLSELRPREHFIDRVLYVYEHRSEASRPTQEVEGTNKFREKMGVRVRA